MTPPLTDSADFRIYLRDINNRLELFGSRVYGQVILGNYRKKNEIVEYFFVTTDGMLSLRAAMSEAAARFRTFAAMAPDGGPSSAKVGSMRKLGDCAAISSQAWEYWLELVEREHVLPRLQGKKWSPRNESIRTPITFCWEAYPAGKTISEFGGGDILIVVDILSPDAPDELSPPAGAQASEPPSTPPPPPAPSTEVALAGSAPAGTQANEAPSAPPQPLLGK